MPPKRRKGEIREKRGQVINLTLPFGISLAFVVLLINDLP